MKIHMKIFWFLMFHTFLWVQNHCVLDEFIKTHDGIRYLVLFGIEWYDEIYNRIRYLTNEKSGNTYGLNQNLARTKNDSYISLPIERILTFHNVIILIKSVFNKNENHYCYNIFLEKDFLVDKSDTQFS